LCASANSLGFVAKLTVIPLYASGHLGASPAEVGNLFSITALLGLVTAPITGLAADTFGKKLVVGVALSACAAGLFLGAESSTQSELTRAIGAWGVGIAAAGPAINALAQELAPKGGEGEALTLPKSAADFVFLVGPLVLGVLDDAVDADNAGMILCACVAALAAVSCVSLPNSSRPSDAS
jgi:MFS family permease